MFASDHCVDLKDNARFQGPKQWPPGEDPSSPRSRSESVLSCCNSAAGPNGNVDRVLFNDLVEMVPLVQSLIDRKAISSFTRRGSMIYTKTPSRESFYRKNTDMKGRDAGQSIPTKMGRNHGDRDQRKNGSSILDGCRERFEAFHDGDVIRENEKELDLMRKQVEDLQRKLSDKDDILKSLEDAHGEVLALKQKVDELKLQNAEKDSLIKSTQLQLSDSMIKLAERQAALEKIQWEAQTSKEKVGKLEADLDSMRGTFSSFMRLFEDLSNNKSPASTECYDGDDTADPPLSDDLSDTQSKPLEEARTAYLVAVATAKQKPDEESIAATTRARLHLQSIVSS